MTDREVLDAFTAWRADLDSVPYLHEELWSDIPAVADLMGEAAR